MLRHKSLVSSFILLFAFTIAVTQPVQPLQAQLEEIEAATKAHITHLSGLTLEELVEELDENWQEYAKQLQAVVKARLLEEREYVAQVTLLIQTKQLPKKLVDSSWLWVRNNRPATKSPFVYFQRILQLQAEKAGFRVPPFDDRIYSLSKSQRRLLEQERRRRR